MSADEMRAVAKITLTADHGCSSCVGSLFSKLRDEWPEFSPLLAEMYRAEWPEYGPDWMWGEDDG